MNNLILCLLLALPPTKHKSVIAGSRDSMIQQNAEIDRLRLPRIVNESQFHQLIDQGELVKVNQNETIQFAPASRQYVRPWCRDFIVAMAADFYRTFNRPLIVDSTTRTVEQQHALRRVNRFAAPEYGELPSSHLAGITVDLAKRKYNRKQRRWIVLYLKNLQDKGLVIATEEPVCFHVAVREAYQERHAN